MQLASWAGIRLYTDLQDMVQKNELIIPKLVWRFFAPKIIKSVIKNIKWLQFEKVDKGKYCWHGDKFDDLEHSEKVHKFNGINV